MDEALVDLQFVNRQAFQIRQARESGTKIIDRELKTMGPENFHFGDDLFKIVNEHTLCKFEPQISGICSGSFKSRQDLLNEARMAHLSDADVHRNRKICRLLIMCP